jgi:dethiobiotin synthetase
VTPPCPAGVVLVGTDTAVGKTTFGVALLRLAHRLGRKPAPYKPVETGWSEGTSDALRLLIASRRTDLPLVSVCPFRFPAPVTPELAGTPLDPGSLLSSVAAVTRGTDYLVIETAGGLLSPYAPRFTSADLAAAFGLPAVLVARNALGTINHSCLALAEIRRRALPLAALILVETSSDPAPDRPHNARLIAEHAGVAPLATLPFVPDGNPDRLADALAAQLVTGDGLARLGLAGS